MKDKAMQQEVCGHVCICVCTYHSSSGHLSNVIMKGLPESHRRIDFLQSSVFASE